MEKVTLTNRLSSMFLDHVIMCLVFPVIMIPYLLILALTFSSSFPDKLSFDAATSYGILFIPFLVYVAKDSFGGRSPAKRMTGLKVINASTGETASGLQCFIRNLLIPIWPLEALITLFSPSRRIGDVIANTRVVIAPKESGLKIFRDIRNLKFGVNTIIVILVGLAYAYLLGFLMTLLGNA